MQPKNLENISMLNLNMALKNTDSNSNNTMNAIQHAIILCLEGDVEFVDKSPVNLVVSKDKGLMQTEQSFVLRFGMMVSLNYKITAFVKYDLFNDSVVSGIDYVIAYGDQDDQFMDFKSLDQMVNYLSVIEYKPNEYPQ